MAHTDQDESDTDAAVTGSGSDSIGGFKPADRGLFYADRRPVTLEKFGLFNQAHGTQTARTQPAIPAPRTQPSRYRLYRVVISPEQELEKLMGRAFQVSDKEAVFNRIFELIALDRSGKLAKFISPTYKCSPVDQALELNDGSLNKIINKLLDKGCRYQNEQLVKKFLNNNELSQEYEVKYSRSLSL